MYKADTEIFNKSLEFIPIFRGKELKKQYFSKNKSIYLIFLCMAIVYISGPLHSGVILVGSDRIFHLYRMEEVYLSLKAGHWVPWISTHMITSVGQATNMYYPWGNIVPYALIRIVIKKPILAFYLYMLLMQFLGLSFAYYSARKIGSQQRHAFIFAILLRFSAYIMHNDFARVDIGEAWALIFVPLVFAGLVLITLKSQYLEGMFLLSFGLAGILYSHLLTTLLTVFVLCLVYLLTWNAQQHKKVILGYISLSAIVFLVLTAAFLVPFIISTLQNKTILPPAGDLSNYKLSFDQLVSWSLGNSLQMNQPNIGIWLILTAFFGIIGFKRNSIFMKGTYLCGILLLVMSSNLFPWRLFRNTPVKMIQFPWRLLSMSIIFLAYFSAKKIVELDRIEVVFVTLLVLIISIGAFQQYRSTQDDRWAASTSQMTIHPWGYLFNDKNYKLGVSRSQYTDYLPASAKSSEKDTFKKYAFIDDKKVKLRTDQIKSSYQSQTFHLQLQADQQKIVLPFYIYHVPDYQLSVNGKKEKVMVNANALPVVHAHHRRNLKITIKFVTPKSYVLAQFVSIIGGITVLCYYSLQRYGLRKKM
ncbi:hypothetical protein FC07_GL001064 [Loigolactobacillus bifermentans DSM 20003]|uniref:Membrane protein 6-pyruvoyl-tetrahydropterin synthase-related domain-containing protein n=1 Tax=Loigolactobacillus bifermentans DSM 20003 TaxID=1423726 RepID=A0A0R1H0R8_9LACO|nr:hypothetical protein FC07_GL001064 [Loigolactobacillus bifermentans DSM 20003]